MQPINRFIFKYCIYFPVVLIRGEWIWRHLGSLRKTQYLAREELEYIQVEKLKKLTLHAANTVERYDSDLFRNVQSLKDLKQLPFLEKDELRNRAKSLQSRNKGFLTRYKTTGGSTGAAVTIRKDAKGMGCELAATWRGYEWAGVDIGDRQARFWGVPHSKSGKLKSRMIDFVANRRRYSAFAFSADSLANHIEDMIKHPPKYFYGYVSMILELSNFIVKNNIKRFSKPKAIITTAEVLDQAARNQLEHVFDCKVFNEYGCGEIGTIAHECKFGNLHINSENIIVEIVDSSSNPVQDGKPGQIVVTDLVNFSMPLIRYKINDFGAIQYVDCKCGVKLPVLTNLYGRAYDFLENREGKKFHGEFFLYLVEDLKKEGVILEGVQFVQRKDLSILINVVSPSVGVDYLAPFFRDRLSLLMEETVQVEVRIVPCIERESSGKIRVVKKI